MGQLWTWQRAFCVFFKLLCCWEQHKSSLGLAQAGYKVQKIAADQLGSAYITRSLYWYCSMDPIGKSHLNRSSMSTVDADLHPASCHDLFNSYQTTFTIYKILSPLLLLKQQQGDTKEPSQLKDDLKSQSVSHNGTKAREQRCIFKWDLSLPGVQWQIVPQMKKQLSRLSFLFRISKSIWSADLSERRHVGPAIYTDKRLKKINSVWFSSISNNIWVESRQQSSMWMNILLKRKKPLAERGSGRGSHLSRPAGVWGERDGKKTGA